MQLKCLILRLFVIGKEICETSRNNRNQNTETRILKPEYWYIADIYSQWHSICVQILAKLHPNKALVVSSFTFVLFHCFFSPSTSLFLSFNVWSIFSFCFKFIFFVLFLSVYLQFSLVAWPSIGFSDITFDWTVSGSASWMDGRRSLRRKHFQQ